MSFATPAKDKKWELLHSLWIGWTFTLGFFSWVAFVYIALRTRHTRWLLWALFYATPLILFIVPVQSSSASWDNLTLSTTMVLGVVSIIHAFLVRKEYLTRLDEYCVVGEIKSGPSEVVPTKGSPDGPSPPHPVVGPPGRGTHRLVLPNRRRLLPDQPAWSPLRLPQGALRLGDPHPRPLPAAQRHRVRTLFPARGLPLLLPPVPGDRRLLAILVPSSRAQAQALLGALAARDLGRTGGRARDDGDRLDPPFGPPSAPGQPVGGRFRGGGVGEVGIVRRLRGEAAPHLRDQPGAHLLRTDARERGGRILDRGTAGRGWHGGGRGTGGSEEAARGPGLPEPGASGGTGRGGDRAGHQRGRRQTPRGKAAGGDLLFEPQAGLRGRGDPGQDPGGVGHQDLKAKMTAYTYAFVVNRVLGRPQGRIKELWA